MYQNMKWDIPIAVLRVISGGQYLVEGKFVEDLYYGCVQ